MKAMPTAPEPEGADRRRAERFPPPGWFVKLSLPRSFIGLGGGGDFSAPILDLSETGARISSPRELKKDQQVRARIEEPKFRETIDWPARVVWVNPPPPIASTWIAGIEFIELPNEQRQKIAGWRTYYTGQEHRRQQDEAALASRESRRHQPGDTRKRFVSNLEKEEPKRPEGESKRRKSAPRAAPPRPPPPDQDDPYAR